MKKHLEPRRYLVRFDTRRLPHVFCDVLVIGSGVAGLRAAIEAAKQTNVLLVSKRALEESNTKYAQGGIAGVLSPDDDFASHIHDTLVAGQGLCDPDVVREVIENAPARIRELIGWGASFDEEQGKISLTREGGHSRPRIIHARGDATGLEVAKTLLARVAATPAIQRVDHAFLIDLLTHEGRCVGAVIADNRWGQMLIWARQTILATGGAGHIYRETTNPETATGDGLAAAYRAGAELRDLEFMQFHPTTLYVAGAGRELMTEAMRGEGGLLRNSAGDRFMPKYHPEAELAPRDVVSRAILLEMKEHNSTHVFLDMRHIPRDRLHKRFPNIRKLCAEFGIDIHRDMIPVRPSAHYTVGGVTADIKGRTTVPNLFACGEAAAAGLHGANRLGSNSLLEGLVFGQRAGHAAASAAAEAKGEISHYRIQSVLEQPKHGDIDIVDVENSLRSLIWRNVGIERTEKGLTETQRMTNFWCRYVMDKEFSASNGWELQNMLYVAMLMTHGALRRTESRGVHHRLDFPQPNDAEWRRHVTVRRGESEPT